MKRDRRDNKKRYSKKNEEKITKEDRDKKRR